MVIGIRGAVALELNKNAGNSNNKDVSLPCIALHFRWTHRGGAQHTLPYRG
jgi:hypothetical protein